jgi:hypothetical protein
MRIHFLIFLFLLSSIKIFSQDCPQPTGLFTDNYTFNSFNTSVKGNWDSLLGTGVEHFLVNYRHIDSLQWNNLANLDSSDNSKVIGLLDFNTTYVWRVAAYCSENYLEASEWSVLDTFTTLEYVECPSPTNAFHDNILVTQQTAFVDLNWDSMSDMGVDHFLIGYRMLNDTSWDYLSNMDSATTTRTIGGDLEHDSYYEWWVQAFCSENQSYYSDWSSLDTFYIGDFQPQDFTPEINIELSSLICEDYSDIHFVTEQGLNEPDIQSTVLSSNIGSIDLENLELGQNVGNATAIAGINDYVNNEYSLVVGDISSATNSVEIDLVLNQETDFSFSITNLEGGGIEISIISPSDDNSYTSGNSLDLTLTDIFINPSPTLLQFDVTIFSELNDDYFNQFDFEIDCETNSLSSLEYSESVFPNPSSSHINLTLEGMKIVKLYDVSGQLLSNVETTSKSLDVSNLSPGLYFIEIQFGNKIISDKLIIR